MTTPREDAEAALMAAVERNYRVITLTQEGAEAAVLLAARQMVIAELVGVNCWHGSDRCPEITKRLAELEGGWQ